MARKSSKENIVKEAFRLFILKGYDRVSIAEIENAANVSRGLVFYYFKSKEDMFKSVGDMFFFNHISSSNEGSQSKYSISETPLRDFIVEQLCAIKNRMDSLNQINKGEAKHFHFYRFILELKALYPSFEDEMKAYEERESSCWINIIELAKSKKEISSSETSEDIASLFRHTYIGLSFKDALFSGLDIEQLDKLWNTLYSQIKTH